MTGVVSLLVTACAARTTGDPGAGTAAPLRSYGAAPPVMWMLEEELAVESPPGHWFTDLLVDGYGRAFVRLSGLPGVHVYDASGRRVNSFAVEDASPGHLEDARGMTWGPGPALWVVSRDRYVVFDTSGVFLGERPRNTNSNARRWRGAGFGEDGFLYDHAYGPGGASHPVLIRLDPERTAVPVDTLPLPHVRPRSFTPSDQMRTLDAALRGAAPVGADSARPRPVAVAVAIVRYPIRYSPEAIWAFDPRGFLWTAVTDRYRIARRSLEGDTLLVIEREVERRPVSPVEKLEIRERMTRRGEAPDTADIPSFKPVLERMFVDGSGRLWVRPALDPGSPAPFDVFDADGDYLARVETGVRLPGDLPVVVRGDRLHYVGPPLTGPAPAELSDMGPVTNHLVRARIVPTDRRGTRDP